LWILPLFYTDSARTFASARTFSLTTVANSGLLSGFNKPSKINEAAFDLVVEQVNEAARTLINSLRTSAPLRDRESVREKAMAEAVKRFGN
jgi:hypothetical protein